MTNRVPKPRDTRAVALPQIDRATLRNRLLQVVPPGDFAHLAPAPRPVELAFNQALHGPDRPLAAIYFPERGIASMLTASEDGQAMEVGLVGCNGLVGLAALLAADGASTEALVQARSTAWRIEVAAGLKAVFCRRAGECTRLLVPATERGQASLPIVRQRTDVPADLPDHPK